MDPELLSESVNRRRFLARAAKAGLCVGASCAVGFGFHTREVTTRQADSAAPLVVPDFSVAGLSPRMGIARGPDRAETVRRAMDAVGGMSAFVRKGDRVLLKVNAAFATPPMLAATTHPDLVAEVTRMCLAAGAASVTVTDNPINDPVACFALTGIEKGARTAGASVGLPMDRWFRPVSVEGGRLIRNWPVLYAPLERVDKLIGMAPVKDHHRSGASMTLKNWYGLLGGRRNIFHQDIHTVIQELAVMVRPTLVILDGTVTMMRNGPTGGSLADLKQTETMIVSTDPVAADAFGAGLLERSAGDLAYIQMAADAGAGTADWRSLNPVFA